MRPTAALALSLVLLVPAACAHPVGPARTEGAYEGKARTTADSAISNVETARLVAKAGADGRAIGPYVSRVLSETEESLSGLAGTFGSIQPPGAKADEVRDELQTLLQQALDHVTALRLRARRGDLHGLRSGLQHLHDDAAQLQEFTDRHAA